MNNMYEYEESLYKEGYKQDDIASFMGISQSTVSGALNKGGR